MFKDFRPLNNHVLVKLIESDKKTSGGIIIPGDSQELTRKGAIVRYHDCKHDDYHIGDIVYFKKYAGVHLDDQYIVLTQEDILGAM